MVPYVLVSQSRYDILCGMSAFHLRATWQRVVGVIALSLPLWQVCRSVLDFSGYIDFFATHTKEPGWVGVMLEWLLNPSPWTIAPAMVLGFGLLIWDGRRRQAGLMAMIPKPQAIEFSNDLRSSPTADIESLTRLALISRVETFTRNCEALKRKRTEQQM